MWAKFSMAGGSKTRRFTPEEEVHIVAMLTKLEGDKAFNTKGQYSGNTDKHPDNHVTFTQKHLEYLRRFPNVNPEQYILNLRLMTRR